VDVEVEEFFEALGAWRCAICDELVLEPCDPFDVCTKCYGEIPE
jgi:hypothetical protein